MRLNVYQMMNKKGIDQKIYQCQMFDEIDFNPYVILTK
ncbi:hypothetical protein AO381_0737 [Moraxella catarrhalis]|nr:hypothetical protein AO381_0737 [Moraxella catarrhalis]OAV07061.1 hypothetical protein AO379_0214 [Moraxella catarrhalis]